MCLGWTAIVDLAGHKAKKEGEKMKYKYYKTKYAKLSPSDVFVCLGIGGQRSGEFGLYCPIGQHSTGSINYLKDSCIEIPLKTYLKTGEGIYTPGEYIEVNK